MTRTIPLRRSSRAWIAALGVGLVAALYHPLELDDLPYGLLYQGRGPILLWSVCGVLWLALLARLDVVWPWCVRHQSALLRLARHGAVYWGLIMVALFYLMYCAAALSLGFWPPPYGQYDPKGFPVSAVFHMLIIGWFWLAPAALVMPFAQLGYALGRRNREEARAHVTDIVAMLVLGISAVVWAAFDPSRLVSWFMD